MPTHSQHQLNEKEDSKFQLFHNPTFLKVWIGDTTSQLGNGVHNVALGLIILQRTGSALDMSLVFAVQFLSNILLGPFAGTYCDRTDRRRLMLKMDMIRALLVVLLIIVIGEKDVNMPLLISISFLISAGDAFFAPAFDSSIVNIVKRNEISQSTSLLQLTNTGSQIAGPALGGLLVATVGGTFALSINAFSYIVSFFAFYFVRFSSPARSNEVSHFMHDMYEGFLYLIKQRLILGIALLGPLFSLFGAAFAIIIPVVGIRIWHVNGFKYGLLDASWPIGMAIAAIFLSLFFEKLKRRGIFIVIVFSLAGVVCILAPVMSGAYAALPFLILDGVFAGIGITIMRILLRTAVPSNIQGRVFSFYSSLANAAWPIGAFLAGYFGDQFSPVLIAVICGVGFMITGLLGIFNRQLRKFD